MGRGRPAQLKCSDVDDNPERRRKFWRRKLEPLAKQAFQTLRTDKAFSAGFILSTDVVVWTKSPYQECSSGFFPRKTKTSDKALSRYIKLHHKCSVSVRAAKRLLPGQFKGRASQTRYEDLKMELRNSMAVIYL